MITHRTTRLVRAASLHGFRSALATLACEGRPEDARNRLVIVPTRAAASHLVLTIENTVGSRPGSAILLPDFVTRRELVERLADRLAPGRSMLTLAEREALLGAACRAARNDGADPPFRLRPGLLLEILRFYDTLLRHRQDVASFERLALGTLEPGAAYDRGAERLVRQTRFLVAAFTHFERLCAPRGDDEHRVRARLLAEAAERPWRHVVVAVSDRAFDPHGLYPVDWDLLARIPGLERLDIVVTDTTLAGAMHEHLHRVLPGIEEVRADAAEPPGGPRLVVSPGGGLVHTARDREEEVAAFARAMKHGVRSGRLEALDRAALVVRQRLPYVYVARTVLHSAGVPCQMYDALPLAAEPYASTVDLVCSAVMAAFARRPAIALLRSPHFEWRRFPRGAAGAEAQAEPGVRQSGAGHGPDVTSRDVAHLDRALAEAGYLGELDALERLLHAWREQAEERPGSRIAGALRAGVLLLELGRQLAPLLTPGPAAGHLSVLLRFLRDHERVPGEEPLRARHLRARGAILGTLAELRDAYAALDPANVAFEETAALVRRWIEEQTFAPRYGESGVHVIDAASARFGDFDEVQLAGLVEGEWPDPPRRSVLYPASLLRELGWPAESLRREAARAAFADLIRLPAHRLTVSTFSLESDAIVSPSILVDEVEAATLDTVDDVPPPVRIFAHEALELEPIDTSALEGAAAAWARERIGAPAHGDERFRGRTMAHAAPAFALSALERYQDCPFKFFAADVLRLEESPDDEFSLSPRARGRFIHEVFQRFFEAWDREGSGTITPDRMDHARRVCAQVAEPLLERLPELDAWLERARLFGSAISVGIVDVVLGLEAARPAKVRERWLEYRLEGAFSLGAADGAPVSLKGVADRIDLLAGNRLRVIDYKSGLAPDPRRALQVPVYALCAQERLAVRDGTRWEVDEASYVAFSGRRPLVPVVKRGGADAGVVLPRARERLLEVLDSIGGGVFPPRPHDPVICRSCAYAAVCREDYAADE